MPPPKTTPKKKLKKRARSSATTRQTGGTGFDFEDRTAAWLMIRLLMGEELPGVGTGGHTIQSQTGALKWRIDDLLVTAGSDPDVRHIALSCKGNVQVSANGMPADFVKSAWEQWRATDSPMQRKTDVLALVTQGHHKTFTPRWSDILTWCRSSGQELAIARIGDLATHTKIFESVKAPEGNIVATDEETVELIRHLEVLPLDFQLEPSSCREDAIGKCRMLLRSGDREEAERVWDDLVEMARNTRVGAGTLALDVVWGKLRTAYDLKSRPNYEGSWHALDALTDDYRAQIETTLPFGITIDRRNDRARIAESVQKQTISVVFGASGSGKSALVKATLDELLANYRQVWLEPEHAEKANSEFHQPALGLGHPLIEILRASATPNNVLVIDSAEKLRTEALPGIKLLIERLVPAAASASEWPWRVVIVSQTEGWRDRLHSNICRPVQRPVGVEAVRPDDVKTVLRAREDLRWLVTRDDVVAALTNLKALGWAIQASTAFQEGTAELTSPAAIADRIWRNWTDGKARNQSLLIRLAQRDAEFERSFRLSEFSPEDLATFDSRPVQLPLRKNSYNRIEFEHDLAADWARFQCLKEVSDDVHQWASLASNPLWGGALRLFGQLLLREYSSSGNDWDHAFSALEEIGEKLAADVLLDALCLDPLASQFLDERTELLFANDGKLLKRLLRRFLHIATVPSVPEQARSLDPALALHLEAKYRTPIYGLWPSIAGFLHVHIERVADYVAPTVAEVCEVWLTTTPVELGDGIQMPWRKEFAEIALATARALQVNLGQRVVYLGDGESQIYSAAFAGAQDLPDQVATWALEMAQRLPQSEDVSRKVADAKANAAAEHAERMRTDHEFRARQQGLAQRRASGPMVFPAARKLPPWPMGPENSVERDFQVVVLHTTAMAPLMHRRPEQAAEIVLAALIEGNPTEDYSETMRFEKLGLEHDGADSYPTAFWKSPFFRFLHIKPDVALTSLLRLVNFASERWVDECERGGNRKAPRAILTFLDGSMKSYVGGPRVFEWAHTNSTLNGQLYCALNALERWLTLEIDRRADVKPYLERILSEGSSLAFVGLLVNIAKYHPELLRDTLLPLLSSADVYRLDEHCMKHAGFKFHAFSWSNAGEVIFNIARDWANAPYRQRSLVQVVSELIPAEKAIGSFLKARMADWNKPDERKEAIEHDILCAQLDEENYHLQRDPATGEETFRFDLPEAVKKAVTDFEMDNVPALQRLMLANQCEQVLSGQAELADTAMPILAQILCDAGAEDDLYDEGRAALNKQAVAATLVANAKKWLEANPEVEQAAKIELRAAANSISGSIDELRRPRFTTSDQRLQFTAYGVFHLWLRSGNEASEWERAVLRTLTSGDDRAVRALGSLAHRHRTELGPRWWRLLELAVLWSALSMFGPRSGDPADIGLRWQRWVEWLRSREVSSVLRDPTSVDLLSVWQRLRRLERGRWRRMSEHVPNGLMHIPDKPTSYGLDTGFLNSFLAWLLADDSRPKGHELEISRQILVRLWSYEVAYWSDKPDERGEFRVPYEFGYNVARKLAYFAAQAPTDQASEIWRGVLGLGPSAHYLVEHFLNSWFLQLHHGCDPAGFCSQWRDMVRFGLDAKWNKDGNWFDEQKILHKLLGFGSEPFLVKLPDATMTIFGMRDLYHDWAQANLQRDERNVAAFSHFLASGLGAGLRIDGLKWLATSFKGATREHYWRDRGDTADALVNLLDTMLREDASVIRDQVVRESLLAVTALLVAKQVPKALALQERIKNLR